jgi:hypothetical protein
MADPLRQAVVLVAITLASYVLATMGALSLAGMFYCQRRK